MPTDSEVVEGHEACCELAVEEVVRRVDGTYARVSVVIGIHAETERTSAP